MGQTAQTDVRPRIGENVATGGGKPGRDDEDQGWNTQSAEALTFLYSSGSFCRISLSEGPQLTALWGSDVDLRF